jgi:hypothetical protein
MFHLTSSYSDFLSSLKSQTITVRTNINNINGSLFLTATAPKQIVIAPLNANLQFTSVKPLTLSGLLQTAGTTPPVTLPVSFDWKDKNSKITQPVSQGHCGCCWAVAVATCISDNFVVQGLTPVNPMLSYTFLLSCFPDSMKCGGGNPSLCLQWIEKNGIQPDSSLYNFSWCLQSDLCTGKTLSSSDQLNQLIPPCLSSLPSSLLYFIKSISTPQLTDEQKDDPIQRELSTNAIKKHIFMNGPVVGGFQVLKNFFQGDYTCKGDNPDNIYLERVNYETCTYSETPFGLAGGHAVVITGWGVGQVKGRLLSPDYDQEKMYNVPYWTVRNSWGTEWGNDGYFRIAHYPFNQQSQFDTTVFVVETVRDSVTQQLVQQRIPTGGILFFETSSVATEKPMDVYESYTTTTFCDQGKYTSSDAVHFFILAMIIFLVLFTLLVLCFSVKKGKSK